MHHLVKAILANLADGLPVRAHCSCGTGGDFGSADEALRYFVPHFKALGGVCSWEFQDFTVPAEGIVTDDITGAGSVHDVPEVPAEDPDRVGGVG